MPAIVLDLETAPIDDAATYLPPPPMPEFPDFNVIGPAKNLVDPAKIAADIEKRRAAALTAYEDAVVATNAKHAKQIADCATDPDLCKIVCIGTLEPGRSEPTVIVCKDEHAERQALCGLWLQIKLHGSDVITFYGHNFDLPVIMRRSLYLGVKGLALSLDRYRSTHVDLYQRLTYDGKIKGHSLSFYAQRFKLPGDLEVGGAEIPELVKVGEWDAIARHCRQDILWTAGIAQKLGIWEYGGETALLPEAVGF